jgi:hypothetical protein
MFNFNPQFNPQQFLNNLIGQNPVYGQAMNMAKQISNNNPQRAKEIVLDKFKNGNINKDEFEKFSYMAKQLGVDEKTLEELSQYVK